MIMIDTATEKDILEFAKNIRHMDAKEVKIMSGKPFAEHIGYLLKHLKEVMTIKCDGVLLGIGGWYQERLDWGLYSEGAVGWLLLTNAVEDHKIEFLRWSKRIVKTILNEYPSITNTVYAKNELHVNYLDFLGASFWEDPLRNDIWHFIIERS
nr:MAG TPA: internal virion protein A [Caudoviricetes sp.]